MGLSLALVALVGLPAGLFGLNGAVLASGETPLAGTTSHPPGALTSRDGALEVRVVAYNIAKGSAHLGGLSFAPAEVVAARIRRLAEVIRGARPDVVFLSEAIKECTPCPVDQVVSLASQTGMHAWVFGENYNFGLPFYRIVGGNAVLSRLPLAPVTNLSLAGRQPFWVTKNNRRTVFASATIAGARVLLGALHTDSYSLDNNLTQTRQILGYLGARPAILAGDFNANPHQGSIQAVRASGRFSGAFDGPVTFPSPDPGHPAERIDFVFAPASWELVEDRVLESDASDHHAVLAVFRVRAPHPSANP